MGMTKEEWAKFEVWASDASDAVFERGEAKAERAGAKAVASNTAALGPAYAAQKVCMGALASLVEDDNILAAKEAIGELNEWFAAYTSGK